MCLKYVVSKATSNSAQDSFHSQGVNLGFSHTKSVFKLLRYVYFSKIYAFWWFVISSISQWYTKCLP